MIDIRKIKVGDVCVYREKENGPEKYMIIKNSYVNNKADTSNLDGCLDGFVGIKVENINNFKDLGTGDMINYAQLDYIRFNSNIYFPVDKVVFISSFNCGGMIYRERVIDNMGNSEIITVVDVEVIGHLSDIQLAFMEMYRIFSTDEDFSHGRICDIDTIDLSEIECQLNTYIKFWKINQQCENIRMSRETNAYSITQHLESIIPQWIEKHIEKFSYDIPQPILPTGETDNELGEDYIEDIRYLEEGGIYQYFNPLNNTIKYIFIRQNPLTNKSNGELMQLDKNNNNNRIIFVSDVEIYHEEGLFVNSDIFSKSGTPIYGLYANKTPRGHIRFDNLFYISNDSRINLKTLRFKGTLHLKGNIKPYRFKLMRKLNMEECIIIDALSNYDLNGMIIDIDKINLSAVENNIEEIKKAKSEMHNANLSLSMHQENLIYKLLGKKQIDIPQRNQNTVTGTIIFL